MRKILNNIYCVFFFFVGSSVMVVTAQPPPWGLDCCDILLEETGDMDAYLECSNSVDPSAYCSAALPIDNSVYILATTVSGIVLVSFLVYKKVKYKKTPI